MVRDAPTRLTSTSWSLPGGGSRGLLYAWEDNGLLDAKVLLGLAGGSVSGVGEVFDYDYDDWKRVNELSSSTGSLETYAYDAIGNLTEMQLAGEGAWVYDPAPFSEVPLRTNASTGMEHLRWRRSSRGNRGRRIVHEGEAPRNHRDHILWLRRGRPDVHEAHSDGREILRFQGWREEDGKLVEKLLPIVSLEEGALRWTMLEPDGHALGTYSSDGDELSLELLGVNGLEAATYTASAWPIDAFHGSDPDRENDTIHRGARHMLLRDGLWMQPEPLLALGPTNGDIGHPLAYTGVYGAGNPVTYADPDGNFLIQAMIVVEVVGTAADAYSTLSTGVNWARGGGATGTERWGQVSCCRA